MAEETTSTVPELEARVQQMEFKLAAIAKSVHLNGLGILNNTARQFNSQARDPQDQLQPLHIVESDEPQSLRYRRPNGFPHTLIEAISLRWDGKLPILNCRKLLFLGCGASYGRLYIQTMYSNI
ncbi:hypothetical protein TWF730_001738 [Orbilia blumenaviensis]|uniref:Uncharacterized protein n=1 Tax=Orbilia blumenaviensis TaxID=1796055 RepID=A0AAV9ULX1_9PEZI